MLSSSKTGKMELKVQHPTPSTHGLNGRLLSRVINPSTMSCNSGDVSLRDQTRLLQLAERIQIKKIPYFSVSGKGNECSHSQSTPRRRERVPDPSNSENNTRNYLDNGSSQLKPTPSRQSSLKKSFTRSKLYSSFSPSKKSSSTRFDPAKTNIEHLVNFRNENKSSPSSCILPSETNNDFPTNHASFHDKTKLANAFSPQHQSEGFTTPSERSSKLKSLRTKTKYGLGQKSVPSDDSVSSYALISKEMSSSAHHLLSDEEFRDEPEESTGAAEARLLTLPKISSANIVALNNKKYSVVDTNDGSITQPSTRHKVRSETETETSESGKKFKNKNKNPVACSGNNNSNESPTGFFSLLLNSSGGSLGVNGHSPPSSLIPNYGNCNCGSSDKVLCSSEACEGGVGQVLTLTGCTNPFLSHTNVESGSLHGPSCFSQKNDGTRSDDEDREKKINDGDRTNEQDCSNNGPTTVANESDRKKSSSLPNEIQPHGIWDEGREQRFERRRPSEPPPIPPDVRRRTLTLKSEFNPAAQLDAVKMRTQSTEGRPQSLDYLQRKAWMKVYRDMDITSAVQTAVEKSSESSTQSETPSPPKSYLHRRSEAMRQLDSTHVVPSSSRGSTLSSLSSTSTPKSNSGSLFQRFSKTFSLRFGNTTSSAGEHFNSSSHKKGRKLGSASYPEISTKSEHDVNRIVDPSSGKLRTKLPVLKSSTREDKCYSGDSGIQMLDENGAVSRHSRRRSLMPTTDLNHPTTDSCSNNGCPPAPISPTSMKKLSLVEIPNYTWDQKPTVIDTSTRTTEARIEATEDDGFVSEDGNEDCSTQNPNTKPGYYHSLPLKYSRERKTALLEKKLSIARGNVIRELLSTEQNYVKMLNDIVQGFLYPCRARKDLFSDKVTGSIFSNIEDILRLHVKLLDSLNSAIDQEDMARSNIGNIFTEWANHFDLYSEYCCHNPMSMATVRQLTLNPEYAEFFEACRRLQLMVKLPLHGFLLRPIQRICQYHLQLNELLKHTHVTHPDYRAVELGVEAMKSVAMSVNDTQRRFDALQEIVRLQASVSEGWEGGDLLDSNTLILHKGDLVQLTEGQKYKETHVIILNNEVLICNNKRDSSKKGTLSFNCRIDLRESVWVNIDSNYEDDYFGMVHNSFRIYRPNKAIWILFTANSPLDKKGWISALENTCKPVPIDHKMMEMAKITAIKLMLTESQQLNLPSYSTLPKSKKSRKNISKVDSDSMLIEIGKLRRSGYNNYHHQPPERSSKFYV